MMAILFVFTLSILSQTLPSVSITIHSSCNTLIDGLHYIKPLENNNIIPVICSNGYTMIDPSLNFDSITSYLSSYDYSRRTSNIFSSELNDFVNWRQWWLPSNSNTLFTISPQCNQCILSTNNNAYYQSNYYFCFKTLPNNQCDINNQPLNIYCNECNDNENDKINWSNCYAIKMSPDHIIETDHNKCVSQTIMARPSMVKDRSFCTCYKPSSDQSNMQYDINVNSNDFPIVFLPIEIRNTLPFIDENIIFAQDSNDNMNDNDASNIYYLSNDDFLYGTYRITQPGEYILSEDILLDFNAPNIDAMNDINFSPNSYDINNLYWWPTIEQINSKQYAGMYSYHGLYTLGFFAGITIECNDVIINLNGYSISMIKEFYLQQRFFSIIELSDRNFISAQGVCNLDELNNEFYASNIIIQNGKLGLTSHHGIHGNNNKNIIIKNVVINAFDVGGIGLNGGNDIQIINCIIGTQNDNIPVLGRYTHARAILPRLKQLVDDFSDENIHFYNRDMVSITQLADRLIKQMDLVYFYVINGYEIDVNDNDYNEWIEAKKLFINTNGYMDAGSSYGILLNGEGSGTLSIGARIDNTANIRLENVEIFGIYNGAIEKVKTVTINDNNGAIRGILSDPIDWFNVLNNDIIGNIFDESIYIGDAYTDIIFAMNKLQLETEWYYLNCMRITNDIMEFVFNGKNINDILDIKCNTDIQMHSIKGSIGLRIDGVKDIILNNIYIHDIINYGNLGSDICGEYEISSISMEDSNIQYGYTGNNAHGIIIDYGKGVFQDVIIENIDSNYGSSYGMNIYTGCDINLIGDIKLNNIYSGSQLSISDVSQLKLPNKIPKSCSIEGSLDANIVYDEDGIVSHTIVGYDLCDDDEQIGACDDCYIWNDEDIHGVDTASDNVNVLMWILVVGFTVLLCLVCYIKMNGYYLRILKRVGVSEETIPLLL